jgi:hypothetical protein
LASLATVSTAEVDEFIAEAKRLKFCDLVFGKGFVRVINRRMAREEKARKNNREYVARHRSRAPRKEPVRTVQGQCKFPSASASASAYTAAAAAVPAAAAFPASDRHEKIRAELVAAFPSTMWDLETEWIEATVKAYHAMDIPSEIRKAAAYLSATHEPLRKTPAEFLTAWLARARPTKQDNGPQPNVPIPPPPAYRVRTFVRRVSIQDGFDVVTLEPNAPVKSEVVYVNSAETNAVLEITRSTFESEYKEYTP